MLLRTHWDAPGTVSATGLSEISKVSGLPRLRRLRQGSQPGQRVLWQYQPWPGVCEAKSHGCCHQIFGGPLDFPPNPAVESVAWLGYAAKGCSHQQIMASQQEWDQVNLYLYLQNGRQIWCQQPSASFNHPGRKHTTSRQMILQKKN